MDNQRRDLDVWEKVMEKTVNAKAKAGLIPYSMIKEIDSKYPKKYRLSVMKDKDDDYREHRNEASNQDKEKAKSHLSSFVNQP